MKDEWRAAGQRVLSQMLFGWARVRAGGRLVNDAENWSTVSVADSRTGTDVRFGGNYSCPKSFKMPFTCSFKTGKSSFAESQTFSMSTPK